MLRIRNIKERDYCINSSTGQFFRKDKDGEYIPMTSEEEKYFIKTNFLIGYRGKNIALSTWASKKARGLSVRNLPGETLEEKRQLLWLAVQENKLLDNYYWLITLTKRIQENNEVTIWYLSQHDKPVAELVKRFVNWYKIQQHN